MSTPESQSPFVSTGSENENGAPGGARAWSGDALVLVLGPDLDDVRPLLRSLRGIDGATVRNKPGAAQLATRLLRDLEHQLLDSREQAGGAAAMSEAERIRIGIVAQSTARSRAQGVAQDLVRMTQEVSETHLVIEPFTGSDETLRSGISLFPEARLVFLRGHGETAAALLERFGSDRVAVVEDDPMEAAGSVERFLGLSPRGEAQPGKAQTNSPENEVSAQGLDREPSAIGDDGKVIDGRPSGEVVVRRPQGRLQIGYVAAWREIVASVRRHGDLAWQLFRRDFLAPYRSSYLGMSWLVIAPVLAMAQWFVVQRNGVLQAGDIDVPYPVFVLIGITMWGLFMSIYTATKSTLTSGGNLLLQIDFPREVLVFKQLGQQIATFLIALAVTFVALGIYGVVPKPAALLLPLAILPLVMLATAIGLVVALISVVAVDLDRLLTTLWSFVLWLTPVVYKLGGQRGFLATAVRWNPLTYLVLAPRDLILEGSLQHPTGFAAATLGTAVVLIFAGRLFHVSEPQMIERLL